MFHDRRSHAEPGAAPDSPPLSSPGVGTLCRPDPRQRLLDAMIETVALRSYDRTTVSRVLAVAGLQEAVFTEHFRDKHDCFMQAVEEMIGRVERAALERFHEAGPWPERVRLVLQSLLRALALHPDGARVALIEMLGAGPAACERHRSALTLFTSMMEEGRSYAANPEHLSAHTSEAIVGGIVSILHRRVLQGDIAELPALHPDLTYFALLPYLDHARAMTISGRAPIG